MEIKNNKINDVQFSSNENKIQSQPKEEFVLDGEFNSIGGSMKLVKDKKGWFDAHKIYYVNKDGSGRLLTAWGSKNFPKGSFSEVFEYASEIIENSNSKRFTDEEITFLLEKIEEKIEK